MTPDTQTSNFETKLKWAVLSLLAIVVFTGGLCATGTFPGQKTFEIFGTITLVKKIQDGIERFQEKYHYLPGDLPNAGKLLPDCSGNDGSDCNPWPATAGDGIVGEPEFDKTWESPIKGRITIPVKTAAGETALFWKHLCLSGFYCFRRVDDIKNGAPTLFSSTSPAAPFALRTIGFIVGYSGGNPLPKAFSPKSDGLKGTILILESWQILHGYYAMNEPGQQALTPREAAMLDRAMDNGIPDSGSIQGYGAPNCFIQKGEIFFYNEEDIDAKDCGLIFKIANGPKDVIPKNRSD
jgi:hypothetical protein